MRAGRRPNPRSQKSTCIVVQEAEIEETAVFWAGEAVYKKNRSYSFPPNRNLLKLLLQVPNFGINTVKNSGVLVMEMLYDGCMEKITWSHFGARACTSL